jgi:hypothetical protein
MGCIMRRERRLVAILILSAMTTVSCTDDDLGVGHYRWEGIRGFAVWPEDTPEAGLEACESRFDDESWRKDPVTTADRFIRTVLGWRQPSDESQARVPEDAPRTAFVMSDGEMPRSALGIGLHLRQLRGCWFVAKVQPREGDVAIDYRWEGREGDFALRVTYSGMAPVNLEVGWGDNLHRASLEKGDTVVIPSPHPGRSGHVLVIPERGPSEFTFGQPLSPPPRIP